MKGQAFRVLLLAALASGACGELPQQPSDGSSPGTSSCSTAQANRFVADTMNEWYLWYREIPNVDPSRYASPEAYLEAIRYRPIDESFSYIAGKAADNAFFSDSQYIGYGFSLLFIGRDLYISQVYPGSSAAEANLQRGDRFLSIGGRTIEELLTSGAYNTVFGPEEAGVRIDAVIRSRDGGDRSVSLTKGLVTIPTVSDTQVYRVGSKRIGYIFFRNFVTPSNAALDAAFAQLKAAGATDLILDLRYNGGGFVSVAQHLGSLIGGTRIQGQVFISYQHNDKKTSRNTSSPFESAPSQSLELPALTVITTRSSASASELVINALRPFIPVTVVGDRTYGKPVGQYGFDFCNKVLHPVSFATVNAKGEGEYFNGFPANCPATDEVGRLIGDPEEASLREALGFVSTGACSRAGVQAEAAGQPRPTAPKRDPFHELIGAY